MTQLYGETKAYDLLYSGPQHNARNNLIIIIWVVLAGIEVSNFPVQFG